MSWPRPAALIGLLALKLLLAVLLLGQGFLSVSGDDFQRALIAYEWARQPFLVSTAFDKASSLWLPLQFWLNGLVLWVIPDLWLVPIVVNLTLSVGGLLYLYGITRRLFDHPTGLLTVVLVGVLPWHAWLSISGMAEIPLLFFLSAGLYYLVRWEFDPAPRWSVLAAVATLGASIVRPEGWLYAVPVSARLGLAGLRHRRAWLLFAAALPWPFVGCWLMFNLWAYGDLWHFAQLSRRNFQLEAGHFDSLALRLFQFPILMALVSPTLTLGAVPAVFRAWRSGSPAVRRFAATVGVGFALLVVAGLFGLGTTSTPQRYVVIPLALFMPLVAGWCRREAFAGTRRWLGLLAMMAYVTANVTFGFQFSREFQDEARVGRLLAQMRDRGLLDARAFVVSDWALVRASREVVPAQQQIRVLVDRWALQVLSGLPEAFVDRGRPVATREGAPRLAGSDVSVIAVKTADGLNPVPAGFTLAGRVGTYALYVAGIPRERMPTTPALLPTTRIQAEFGARLRLDGYRQDDWAAGRVVRLLFDWTDERQGPEALTVQVRLIGDGAPAAARRYPLGAHLPTGSRPRPLEVPVRFDEDFNLPPGRYALGVTVLNPSGEALGLRGSAGTDPELVLGPFYLIESKREVLKRVLTTRSLDPRLVARVLLSL